MSSSSMNKVSVLRVEQLYPLHINKLESLLKKFKNIQNICWAQEEPKNMGAWDFINPYLTSIIDKVFTKKITLEYVGRPKKSGSIHRV